MIRNLHISNFKRFQDTHFDLGRLTVLTGANGSGKTSLIHSLLLLQRADNEPRPSTVALNDDDGLQLGEGADVLNWEAHTSEITFEYQTGSGDHSCWKFGIPDERTLHLPLVEAPGQATEVLSDKNRRFTYVSADRLGPRDVLGASSVSTEDLGVGCHGQFVAQVLAVLGRHEVPEGRRTLSPNGDIQLHDLLHQTEWWTRRIVRPIEIQAERFPNSMITRLRFKTPGIRGEWTRPPNMGYGVSYALPLIVAGLVAPPNGLLIVENPEAHLHPAGQSEIGRFLGRIAATGVQVIAETHSDHVLNGIRHAAADFAHPLDSEDTEIIFFLPEGDSRGIFLNLKISRSGSLDGWPRGFFDQIDQDLRALADLQRRQGR
ncbi:MAG: DUF3696 domain-containing protein [Myxococcota bacterium]